MKQSTRSTGRKRQHAWAFKPRFRRAAFGWKSQPAQARVKEAVAEIKRAAKLDPVLGAEGAVLFLERVSPALDNVDGSSGALGAMLNAAIEDFVGIIARAPVDAPAREAWLDRLFAAHAADQTPWIEGLAEHWGDLCVSKETASAWADRLLERTRAALRSTHAESRFFNGTSACLSALVRAERFDDLVALLDGETFWMYRLWIAKSLLAQGKWQEALREAEACRNRSNGPGIDAFCEKLLLGAGRADEAYRNYALRTHVRTTYAATFRAVAQKYPHKAKSEILSDLAASTSGMEGKWFAAAKDAGLLDEAIALARQSPADPRTLTRACRDFAATRPEFALEAGLLAIHWLVEGYGEQSTDVASAFAETMAVAVQLGQAQAVFQKIRARVAEETFGDRFVTRILKRELRL